MTAGSENVTVTQAAACGNDPENNTCSYTWNPIPDIIRNDLRIKITNNADANVTDSSDNNFTIKANLTLTRPTGGEKWHAGTSEDINWKKRGNWTNATYGANKVNLSYSFFHEGVDYNITSNYSASCTGENCTYPWSIPSAALGTDVQVKVISLPADVSLNTTSQSGQFNVSPYITVLYPNSSGIVKRTGQTLPIQWNVTTGVTWTRCWYSKNNGAGWIYLEGSLTNTTNNTLQPFWFNWTIGDGYTTVNASYIRVAQDDGSNVTPASPFDDSDNSFLVVGSISIVYPDGGESLYVGNSSSINWTSSSDLAGRNVTINMSTDGGSTYSVLAYNLTNGNTGLNWTWDHVNDTMTDIARIKVELSSDPVNVNDSSNNTFKIKGVLNLTAPNSTSVWVINTTNNITWTYNGSAMTSLKINYTGDSGQEYSINLSVPKGNSPYAWKPDPLTYPLGTSVKVKIWNPNDADGATVSTSLAFKMRGIINLTAPDGGENLTVNETYNINWTGEGQVGNVNLSYDTSGGSGGYTGVIASNVAFTDFTYPWKVNDSIGIKVKVRISRVGDTGNNDTSTNNFSIKGKIFTSHPDQNDVWIVGTQPEINWTYNGTIPSVNITYFNATANTTFKTAASQSGGSGSWNLWTVPDDIGNKSSIQVMIIMTQACSAAPATLPSKATSPLLLPIRGWCGMSMIPKIFFGIPTAP